MSLPQDIVNRALDSIGASGSIIGAFTDGTAASEAARRVYGSSLRRILRTAHWNFARKSASLLLLADATGETTDVATGEAISSAVEPPWRYAYAWPNDGVQARWLPWNNNPDPNPTDNIIAVTPDFATNASPWTAIQAPARFLVSSSDQFPAEVGQVDWDNLPELGEGQGPISRRVILTDMPQATLVYTRLVTAIEEWDPLFEEAFVADLASRLALPVLVSADAAPEIQGKQRQLALAMRAQQVAIAKDLIVQARIANGNDAGFPQSIDHTPDWIRGRRSGAGAAGFGWGLNAGFSYSSGEAVGWADGTVF